MSFAKIYIIVVSSFLALICGAPVSGKELQPIFSSDGRYPYPYPVTI